MTLSDELNDRGLVPMVSLILLSTVSANRGILLLGGPDIVTGAFGAGAPAVYAFAGLVGIAGLVEILTDLEVVPDAWRL